MTADAGEPPTSNTGATSEEIAGTPGSGFYGWDWSATTHDASLTTVPKLLAALGSAHVLPGKGLQGWSRSVKSFDRDGYALGAVYFGGGREDLHVLSTSSVADSSRRAVVGLGAAKTARVDTRVDTLVPFDDLVRTVRAVADPSGALVVTMESEVRGESQGRTVYVGAPSSRIRVRVYEKWLQSPGEYEDGTNRVEVQLRPASRVKGEVSGWTPAETFCASRMTRDLAQRLGDDFAPVASVQKRRPTPTLQESMEAMGKQYGPGFQRWMDFSGGDLDTVLGHLLPDDADSIPVPF